MKNPAVRTRLLIILILIIANLSAILILTHPKPDYSYTGNYTAKVYEDGKFQKDKGANSLMVLNGDGKGSLVIDGIATNGKWKIKDGTLKIGDKELSEEKSKTKGEKIFIYNEKDEKIVFTSKEETEVPEGTHSQWEDEE